MQALNGKCNNVRVLTYSRMAGQWVSNVTDDLRAVGSTRDRVGLKQVTYM